MTVVCRDSRPRCMPSIGTAVASLVRPEIATTCQTLANYQGIHTTTGLAMLFMTLIFTMQSYEQVFTSFHDTLFMP